MARIGFIGLGRMGRGMAERLIAHGHDLHVWNRTAEKAAALATKGARLAATPAAAASGADAVLTMLADDPASREVWLGASGALATLRPGAFAIECSTVSRDHVLELARLVKAKGGRFIDCPVTGRPNVAAQGKLTLLVGADPADLRDARPLLDCIGDTIRHFGAVGNGTAYKLLINLMGAVQIAALAEGLVMAERLGLDREAVIGAIENSAAASRQVVHHVRRMAERNFADPSFTAALRHKDAAYGHALAREVGAAAPLGEASVAWFQQTMAGAPDGDEARVVEVISRASGG